MCRGNNEMLGFAWFSREVISIHYRGRNSLEGLTVTKPNKGTQRFHLVYEQDTWTRPHPGLMEFLSTLYPIQVYGKADQFEIQGWDFQMRGTDSRYTFCKFLK